MLLLATAMAPGHALGAATSPGPSPSTPLRTDKLRVVATSADLKSLVEAVGGERVEVESLAAPEQDPHAFEAKPAQLARVRAAALVVRVGLDHEPWFARLKLPREVPVLDASRNVRLLQTHTPRLRAERRAHVHAYGNTHYWLDPANARAITAGIRDALAKLSPQDAQAFDASRAGFIERLGRKIGEWQAALAPFRAAKLVVVHDSWAYFADAFGLQIVAAAEPQPGVPASAAELAALVERMREAGVRILIADPSSNPALVRTISERTGAQAVTLHPSGYDYLRLLDENVARLAAALKRTAR
jgi:ABC-type Zn uptake system ZnuABC Zn-binding protein ZnuA